ncbi:MAG: thioesterase family protein, partial [Ilumatobacteraceae bacterium]
EEIDDAIRFGPGIRWSFMGTFLIYRIAGGEAGMRHFMAQFGPSLKWPWTKLMDVPELDDALLEKIVSQSDDQAGPASIRELEALRDDCLVSVIQGLRTRDYASGRVLDRYERMLVDRMGAGAVDLDAAKGPLRLHDTRVPTEWVDYNGHMNDSRYMQMASETIDRFLRHIGMDAEYLAGGHSFFTVESHLNFIAQASAGDLLYCTVQVLSHDAKKMRLFTSIHRADDDSVVATSEHMLLHVDTAAGRAVPAADGIVAALDRIAAHHSTLPAPANAGRAIGTK